MNDKIALRGLKLSVITQSKFINEATFAKKMIKIVLTQLFLFLILTSQSVYAEQLPLWEIGGGGGVLHIPDYRGAAHSQTFPYPFVVPFIRGKYLVSDEDGVRGELLETSRVRFDFSLDGTVPSKSNDTTTRQGLPNLDPTLQIGPALNIKLWQDDDPRQSIIALIPLRAVFALNSAILDPIGFTFSPHLTYYRKIPFIGGLWNMGLSGGLEFGSERFHDYYYQVDPQYQINNRQAYDAAGGYGGYRFTLTFHHRIQNTWISFFSRYDRVDGAVFANSPLVDSKDGLTAGFVVTWFFYQSEQKVESIDWKYE